ncbi:N-acetylmuramoyl-L-alanine amidase [Mycobacteroides chelonae CCUG 47445]|nr:N-acetylmuramoyl-L-alanine amidase [Mycobacteroides chelonae CCUG 47445]
MPGGWIERGESPESAAIREVWEETGMRIADPHAVGATTTVHPEGLCSLTVWVVSRWESGEPICREPDKFVEQRWCALEAGLPTPLFGVWTDLLASPTYTRLRELLVTNPYA